MRRIFIPPGIVIPVNNDFGLGRVRIYQKGRSVIPAPGIICWMGIEPYLFHICGKTLQFKLRKILHLFILYINMNSFFFSKVLYEKAVGRINAIYFTWP